MFNVGQMVAFIGCDWNDPTKRQIASWAERGIYIPERGRVYTVRDIGPCFVPPTNGYPHGEMPHIRLEELVNPPCKGAEQYGEANWPIIYFRPVRPQSIEWAREIARDVKQPQRENV